MRCASSTTRGRATEAYPANPNGSPDGLTAVTTADGRFTVLMPHPERVFRNVQMSWSRRRRERAEPVDAHVPQRAALGRLRRDRSVKARHWAMPFLLGLALTGAAPAQTASASAASAATSTAAKRLFAVEIRTGPQWNAALPPNQQAFMREHSAHLSRLREEGRIRIGARYGEIGLVLLEAASIEEARAWMDADLSMRGGTFRFEIHPFSVFYGGAVAR